MIELEKDWQAVSLIEYKPNDPDRRMPLEGRSPGVHMLAGRNTVCAGGPPTRTVALCALVTDFSPFAAAASKAADLRAAIEDRVNEQLADDPAHVAYLAADQRVQAAQAELDAAERKLADAQAAREQAIADRIDPRPFRAAIAAAEADVADLRPLASGLLADRMAAGRADDAARDRIWHEVADKYRAIVMGEWRTLRDDIRKAMPELVGRLLTIDACEKVLAAK